MKLFQFHLNFHFSHGSFLFSFCWRCRRAIRSNNIRSNDIKSNNHRLLWWARIFMVLSTKWVPELKSSHLIFWTMLLRLRTSCLKPISTTSCKINSLFFAGDGVAGVINTSWRLYIMQFIMSGQFLQPYAENPLNFCTLLWPTMGIEPGPPAQQACEPSITPFLLGRYT